MPPEPPAREAPGSLHAVSGGRGRSKQEKVGLGAAAPSVTMCGGCEHSLASNWF